MGKNLIGASLAFLATGFTVLSSCKKDSDNNSIVGTWELSSEHIIEKSTTPPINTDTVNNYTHGKSVLIIFTSDRYTVVSQSGPVNDTVAKGEYSFTDNKIITRIDGAGYSDTANAVVSGNTFTLSDSDVSPGYTYSYTNIYLRQ